MKDQSSVFNPNSEKLRLIKADIAKENVSSIKYTSALMMLFSAIMCTITLHSDFGPGGYAYYAGLIISSILLIGVFVFRISSGIPLKVLIIIAESGLYLCGLINSYNSPDQLTVLFICAMMINAMAYTDRPIRTDIVLLTADLCYFIFVWGNKYENIRIADAVDISLYSMIAIFFGTYLRHIKVQRLMGFYHEQQLAELNHQYAYMDSMTELNNSRAYHDRIEELDNKMPEYVCIISADVNGLKETNDTHGHRMGDELISTTAALLKEAFGSLGTVYRIGGDEFLIIITEKNDLTALLSNYEAIISKHNRTEALQISISLGAASSVDYPGKRPSELVAVSDAKMYEKKRQYHITHDRRKS